MGVVSINGTVALFFANLCGKIFGAIYRIPLSNMLGTEGIGLYQMAFPIYSFLLTFITGGVSLTLSRKIATARARGNINEINKIFYMGKRASLSLGLIFAILLVLFAYPIAYLQGNSLALYGYFSISLGFTFASLLGAYRGYYQGFSNMFPTAISQVIEQIIKLISGLILAYFLSKFGLIWGVCGALLGISISEIFTYLYFKIFKNIKILKPRLERTEYVQFCRDFLPVSVSYGISPLSSLIDSFLVVNFLNLIGNSTTFSTSLYGIETGMILPLINIPNVLISALAVTIIPIISYKLAKGDDISSELGKIFRIVLLFIIPCCLGMFLLSKPIIMALYPTLNLEMLEIAIKLLKFSCFEMFFLCFVTITNSCLQACGKSKTAVLSLGVGLGIKVILTTIFVLIPSLNILGLVLANFVGYFVSSIISLKSITKISSFKLSIKSLVGILTASTFMSMLIIGTKYLINLKSILSLGSVIFLSIIMYFLILAIFGELKLYEIKKLLQKNEK